MLLGGAVPEGDPSEPPAPAGRHGRHPAPSESPGALLAKGLLAHGILPEARPIRKQFALCEACIFYFIFFSERKCRFFPFKAPPLRRGLEIEWCVFFFLCALSLRF